MNRSLLIVNSYLGGLERELLRYLKSPLQTIFNSVFTTICFIASFYLLYKSGVNFIVTGFIFYNSFSIISSNLRMTIFVGKIDKTLYYQLASPLSRIQLYSIYSIASILRSFIVSILIYIICFFLFRLNLPPNIPFTFFIFLMVNFFFVNINIIIIIHYNDWNSFGIADNYIISPLLLLSGCFFSITSIPDYLKSILLINPLFHAVNLFRHSLNGTNDYNIYISFSILFLLTIVSTILCLFIFKKGYKILS